MIVLGMFLALIIGDVLIGGLFLAATWLLWRAEVRFKRRFSISDPKPFFEFNDWLHTPSRRSYYDRRSGKLRANR